MRLRDFQNLRKYYEELETYWFWKLYDHKLKGIVSEYVNWEEYNEIEENLKFVQTVILDITLMLQGEINELEFTTKKSIIKPLQFLMELKQYEDPLLKHIINKVYSFPGEYMKID